MANELLNKAISGLSIQDVYLRECIITQKDSFDPKAPGYAEVEVQFLHRPASTKIVTVTIAGQDKQIKLLKAEFEAIFRILPPKDASEAQALEMHEVEIADMDLAEQKAEVNVKALFIAEYLITSEDLEPAAIDEFCKFNVGYHVWPYWRELTQSIGNRLRLPPIIPPFYRVPEKAQASKK